MWSMLRAFSLVWFTVCSVSAQDKSDLMAGVLQTASGYEGIAPVADILRRDNRIFRFVPSICPLRERYRISDRFGYRTHPITHRRQFHSGIDLAAAYAATVHAAADGVVTFAGVRSGYGRTVVIAHRYGFRTQYSHLTRIYCREGQRVTKGGVIGFVGSTGTSTGNHLHYEIVKNSKKINPLNFMVWNLETN